jgi:serine/threonine-protein phosphatase CPPED1
MSTRGRIIAAVTILVLIAVLLLWRQSGVIATPAPVQVAPPLTPTVPAAPVPLAPSAATTAPSATRAPAGSTATPAAPESGRADFAFAVLGDNRDGDETYARLLEMVNADAVDFLVNTGDLVSSGRLDQFTAFQKLMAVLRKPFYPVPGNHDVANDGTLANYLQFSGAPAAHYSFDRGQVHFSMANSSLGDLSAAELAWLEADLVGTVLPVRIVVLHHPPFDPLGGSHILGKGATELMALAARYRVRYVLAGHIHEYAREVRDGVTYLVAGGGGAPLVTPPDRGGFYHYVRITVHGQETSDEVVRLP